ncbi:GNAT family N-acetyltransferase [Viridibacillus soli]|uniref:GNAT family N-acetyltransferase n=1 Tax=Viridibacillus soli TaxID=2798301 RepID=UPI002D7F405D|nr:GNAT family N-acetyltransferase [Viridibacillus soli]
MFNAAIYDVIVYKDYQVNGIAKKIVEELIEQLKDISCIHLISTTGLKNSTKNLALKS